MERIPGLITLFALLTNGFIYGSGELAMVKPSSKGFNLISKTKVALGSEQHWAHPVLCDGVLYVRHGKALLACKIRG